MKTKERFGSSVKLLALGTSIVLFFGSGMIFEALNAVAAPRIFDRYHNTLYCALLVLISIPFYWGLTRYYAPRSCWEGFVVTAAVVICAGTLRDVVAMPWWAEPLLAAVVAGTLVKLVCKSKAEG